MSCVCASLRVCVRVQLPLELGSRICLPWCGGCGIKLLNGENQNIAVEKTQEEEGDGGVLN